MCKQNYKILDLMMTARQYELLQATDKNKTQKIRELLAKGVNPNCRHDITPLHAAARRGNVEVVKALLKAGANPNMRSLMGHTVLEFAMTSKRPLDVVCQIVDLLLRHGAKADTHGAFLHHSELARALKCARLEKLFPSLPEKEESPVLVRGSLQAQVAWAGLMVGEALGSLVAGCSQSEVQRLYPLGVHNMEAGAGAHAGRKVGMVGDAAKRAYTLHVALHESKGWSCSKVIEEYRKPASGMGKVERATLSGVQDSSLLDNGALTRVLPLALWAADHPDFDWMTAVREDTSITHTNAVCAEVSAVYVHAVLLAMKSGATSRGVYEASLAFAGEQGMSALVQDVLRRVATERPVCDGANRGSVLVALHSVFYQLLHARDFRSALEDIVNAGGEAGSNAALAGALLALVHGGESIPRPWLVKVRAVNERNYTRLLPSRS